jgi:hypothetical protein
MNCFEARNDFVAFWQRILASERRVQLVTHLHGCPACDRSFRLFALTAPVLYSGTEPDWSSAQRRPVRPNAEGFDLSSAPRIVGHRSIVRRLNGVLPAFVMATAAAIALYFSAPPRMTFEDAFGGDNSNAEVESYPSTDSFFVQELMAENPTGPDPSDE